MGKSSVGRAVLLGALVAGIALACAQGGELPNAGGSAGSANSSSSSSGAGGTDGGGGQGAIGSPCKSNADCEVGSCAPIGGASYCTQVCPPACPSGTYCSIINGASICVPDLDQQCIECASTTECKLPSDACLTAPLGDKFCARDCTVEGVCPNGFTCLDLDTYVGDADGGAPDAGASDAGADAADSGGPPPTAPFKWCVPNSGFSCPCNAKRDGVSHACSVTNVSGTCGGEETCNGAKGAWEGCSAATPKSEACNQADDDCNGAVDDGDPNALCASEGPKPPHASWACKTGTCSLGACDPGWTNFPAGAPANGCACPVEVGEPNGTCGTATPVGSVTDTGAPITITGTLSSAADIDVWTFDAVDVDEGTTNSYHVAINFTAPTPNSEFLMDVIREAPCTDTPTGPAVGITAYDWCVNASDGASPPSGELNCGPTAAVHCGGKPNDSTASSHTAKYHVRVYRKPGATSTCTQYKLTVSGGGGSCDLTRKCP